MSGELVMEFEVGPWIWLSYLASALILVYAVPYKSHLALCYAEYTLIAWEIRSKLCIWLMIMNSDLYFV